MYKVKNDIIFYAIIIFILIFALSPHNRIPQTIDSINTNYLHILSFLTLSLYLDYIKKIKLLNVLYFVLAFGLFIEVTQGLFTTREFDLFDVVFDLIGFGLSAIFLISKKYFIYFHTIRRAKLAYLFLLRKLTRSFL